jgi:hypothetical protein
MISVDPHNARSDEAVERERKSKPYTTPELRNLGSLKERTLTMESGVMEDASMSKKTAE